MSIVDLQDLHNHFNAYITLVKNGEQLTITEHGKPIALIIPIQADRSKQTLQEMIESGIAQPPATTELFTPNPLEFGVTVSDLVAEQRR